MGVVAKMTAFFDPVFLSYILACFAHELCKFGTAYIATCGNVSIATFVLSFVYPWVVLVT